MMNALRTIDLNKEACTGVSLSYDSAPILTPHVDSEDSFISLVSDYYKFFREAIAADVGFLAGVENHHSIARFGRAIYLLRTAKQHDDNAEATAFYKRWVVEHLTWRQAADALATLLNDALEELARISGQVRRDAAMRGAWASHASTEPASVFQAVCDDLGVSFGQGTKNFHIRNIEKQAQRIRPGRDVRAEVEALCVEAITSQGKRLPVSYYEVLNRLGLMGQQQARAAVLLAYSVSASTSLRGEEFLTRVEETWKVSSARP